ncbi:MAG TPA: GDSL-type esterase/lipase family protein [Stellaceae bacterium]
MRLLMVLGSLLLAAFPAAAAPQAPDCSVPSELVEDDPRLPELAEHLRQKHPITIVVVGGASTAGLASGNPGEYAYPQRLQAALKRLYPDVPITVLNKGVSRQTTQEMVDRFPSDVYTLSPTLVIWETGTFDAARGVDVDVFATALESGLAELREHKLETMLINMQYSRSTASVINFMPYLEAMQHIADVDGVYLFRRFEVMKYWAENGIFSFGEVPVERRTELARQVYQCLADRLTDAIAYAITTP